MGVLMYEYPEKDKPYMLLVVMIHAKLVSYEIRLAETKQILIWYLVKYLWYCLGTLHMEL